MDGLAREQIEAALAALDVELGRRGVRAELYLVGGAVMCLALDARAATKDIDGWFTEPRAVREAARVVADAMGLPEDWLNDAAKGFVPPGAGFERWRSLLHLEILVADDRTLLAMKCAAARTMEDAGDIAFLAERLGLRRATDDARRRPRLLSSGATARAHAALAGRNVLVTSIEALDAARLASPDFQRSVNAFVDEFRRAKGGSAKLRLVEEPIGQSGALEGLFAAVVSALCREAAVATPSWVASIGSPEPFFAFPAKSYAMRVRLMIESPAPFRTRNVFVPENYLSRA